jgi:hypothetical protein
VNRTLRAVLVGGCALGAAALSLLAVDALRLPGAIKRADIEFRIAPSDLELWQVSEAFPFGATRSLLGLGDDLAYRTAVQTFRRGQERHANYQDTDIISIRARAQQQLAAIVAGNDDAARRSAAANLIGALGFVNAAVDQNQSPEYLGVSVDSFRLAIALQPGNEDAKFNLELALKSLKVADQQTGTQPQGQAHGGRKHGAGTGAPGTGY